MVVNSENKAFAYDNLSQEFAPSSSAMTLQQPQQVVPLQELPEFTLSSLTKQNSILSLTLEEFQCKSGKSFGSMSMDEFIASIWNSDDNDQVNQFSLPNTHDGTGSSTSQSKSVVATEQVIIPPQQGTFSVPPPICKKTVDEVWCQIQQPRRNEANNIGRTLQRQRTLGEMTLDDFLVKAGVVQEPSLLSRIAMAFHNQTGIIASNNNCIRQLDARYGFRPEIGVGFCTQQNFGSRDELASYQILAQNYSSIGRAQNTSSAIEKCQNVPESSASNSRKRIIDGPPELAVERRQRRMLKNRESAARSRARRQAYTVELEAELSILKQENDKLKEILSEAESKRKQEILHRMQLTHAQMRTEKMRAIRRTVSTAW